MRRKKERVAFLPGKFFAHKGHIMDMKWLFTLVDRLVIGIGSCFEFGDFEFPVLAIHREKMVAVSLLYAGVDLSKVEFVHLEDFNDWEVWLNHLLRIMKIKKVTHFVTGNQAILDYIADFKLPYKIINPEKELPEDCYFPYHSTDMKNAAKRGDLKLFYKIAASGTGIVLREIGDIPALIKAMEGNGEKFIPGRQTVDMIVFTKTKKGRLYLLDGFRNNPEKDFYGYQAIPGGGVNEYESPWAAVLRELKEETGLDIEYYLPYSTPTMVIVREKNGKTFLAEMKFVGMFGSNDPKLSGTKGGSSLVFVIMLEASPMDFNGSLKSESDLARAAFRPVDKSIKKGWAFQQTDMVKKALKIIKKGENK